MNYIAPSTRGTEPSTCILKDNIIIGDYNIIYGNVLINENVIIGSHCAIGEGITKDGTIILSNSVIGSHCIIDDGLIVDGNVPCYTHLSIKDRWSKRFWRKLRYGYIYTKIRDF